MQYDDESKGTAKVLGWLFGIACVAGLIAGAVLNGEKSGWKIAKNDQITNVETRVEKLPAKPVPKPVRVISVTCVKPALFSEPVTFTVGEDGVEHISIFESMIRIQRDRTPEHTKIGRPLMVIMTLNGCIYTDKWLLAVVE